MATLYRFALSGALSGAHGRDVDFVDALARAVNAFGLVMGLLRAAGLMPLQ